MEDSRKVREGILMDEGILCVQEHATTILVKAEAGPFGLETQMCRY